MTGHNEGLGNKPIIVIIGLISSGIAIFSFFTGRQSIFEILRGNSSTPQTTVPSYSTLAPYSSAQECLSYQMASEWDKVAKCYTNIVLQHPEDFWALYAVANAYGNHGDYQLALETGQQMMAIAKTPAETAQAFLTTGIAYKYLGNYNAAINHLLYGSQLEGINDIRRTELLLWLAGTYQANGQTAEACNYFRQTLDLAEKIDYEWAIGHARASLQNCP